MQNLLLAFALVFLVPCSSSAGADASGLSSSSDLRDQFRRQFQRRMDYFTAQVAKVLPKALAVPVGVGMKRNISVPKHNFENGDLEKEDDLESVEVSGHFFTRLLQQEVGLRIDLPFLVQDLLLKSEPCVWNPAAQRREESDSQINKKKDRKEGPPARATPPSSPHLLVKKLLQYITFPTEEEWVNLDAVLHVGHNDGNTKAMDRYYAVVSGLHDFKSTVNEFALDQEHHPDEEQAIHAQKSERPCAENLLYIAVKLCAPVEVALEVIDPILKDEATKGSDGGDDIPEATLSQIRAFSAVYAPKTVDPKNHWRRVLKQQSSCGLAKHLALEYGVGKTTSWERVEEILEQSLNWETALWTRESLQEEGEAPREASIVPPPGEEFDPRKEYLHEDHVTIRGASRQGDVLAQREAQDTEVQGANDGANDGDL